MNEELSFNDKYFSIKYITIKKLLFLLLIVPMVSFGQTKIGYGTQTHLTMLPSKIINLHRLVAREKSRVDVEISRVPEPTIYDPSARLQDVLSILNVQEKQREAKRQSMDAAAQRMGYSSGREYYFAQRKNQQEIKD